MPKIPAHSSKNKVADFLLIMKSILSSDAFNLDEDFEFQLIRAKDEPDDEFTNTATMLALNYDRLDIVEELKTLELSNYVETQMDILDPDLDDFYVFGKVISGREVYIKVRLKQSRRNPKKYVFCISFHFARHPLVYYFRE